MRLDDLVHQRHRRRVVARPERAAVRHVGLHHQARLHQRGRRLQVVPLSIEPADAAVNHSQVGTRGPDLLAGEPAQLIQLQQVVRIHHRHHELIAHQMQGKHLQAHRLPPRHQAQRRIVHVQIQLRDHRDWL
jgi:hypothetical protein